MTYRIVAALCALALATAGTPAAAQPAPGVRVATLTVSGRGSVTRSPDRASVALRIESNADSAASAASANAAIVATLATRLAALNVPASALTTTGYGLSYTPRPAKPDPASTQRYGYTVERSLEVALDGPGGAGAAIDAAVAAGVTNVDGVSFALRDPAAAQRSAQAAAYADAVAQARGLAAAAHVRLVRILEIAPAGTSPAPRSGPLVMSALAVATTIPPGNLTATATVTVRYEIAPE
jgi:uncharacterized protein YggE